MASLIWLEVGQSLDLTALASEVKLSTGLHGFTDLSAFVRCGPIDAFYFYNRPGLPRLLISDGATTIYDGRLEDVAVVAGGVRLKALGYARALLDTLYTATHSAAATSAIAGALVGSVNGVNSGQLSASTALIDTNALTVTETYNDLRPAEILDRLAGYGDTSGNLWEWGVYEGQALYFRQRGAVSQAWFVDAFDLELEQSIDGLYNSAYATYTNGTNTTYRTAAATDANSIAGFGLTRQGVVNSNAKAAAAAGYEAATFLADHKDAASRARIAFSRVFDTAGQLAPLYMVRAGDTITVRNIPVTASGQVDRLRKFYVALTDYNADANVLTVEPSLLTPSLAAQISAGGGSAQGGVDPRIYIDPASTVTFAGVNVGSATGAGAGEVVASAYLSGRAYRPTHPSDPISFNGGNKRIVPFYIATGGFAPVHYILVARLDAYADGYVGASLTIDYVIGASNRGGQAGQVSINCAKGPGSNFTTTIREFGASSPFIVTYQNNYGGANLTRVEVYASTAWYAQYDGQIAVSCGSEVTTTIWQTGSDVGTAYAGTAISSQWASNSLSFANYDSLGANIAVSGTLPYVATIPYQYTVLRQWSISFLVSTTNNASNYWTIELCYSGSVTVLDSFSTAGFAPSAWNVVNRDISALLTHTTQMFLLIRAVKVGSPGNISVMGPQVRIGASG